MPELFKKPDFEVTKRDHSLSLREQQEVAARTLVDVLELAEALPYTPRRQLDRPVERSARKSGAAS